MKIPLQRQKTILRQNPNGAKIVAAAAPADLSTGARVAAASAEMCHVNDEPLG
jgi:hypothetical protein